MTSASLIKFCKPAHHLARSAGLRVGTLFHFRRIEDPEKRDEGEGTLDMELRIEGEVQVAPALANLLIGHRNDGSGFPDVPGQVNMSVERIEFRRLENGAIVFKDSAWRIEHSISDCLVFCMSLVGTPPPFRDRDTWPLAEGSIRQFAEALTDLVDERAKADHGFTKDHSELLLAAARGELQVRTEFGPVMYQDRLLKITQANVPTVEQVMSAIREMARVKAKSFAHEREFRFMCRVFDRQREYPPLRPVLLPTKDIYKFAI